MRLDLKKIGFAVVAAALSAASLPAQSPARIAIINIQGAIVATKDGSKAREAIRVKYEPKAKDLEGRNAELQKKRDQLAKGANTMSQEARDKLSREIDDFQKKAQWDSEDLQNELQQEEGKLVNEIGGRMMQVIDEYAKGQNFAIVLDVSTQQSPVLWAANGIDITQQIVDLYDKKSGSGEAPAAKPAAGVKPPSASPAANSPAAAPRKPAGVK